MLHNKKGRKLNIAWLCLCLSVFLLLSCATIVAFADEGETTVPCTEDSCGGTYKNGICSANGTHYQKPTLNDNGTKDDTSDDYYEIGNAGQLYWFAAQVNGGQTAINAKLTDNITVNPGTFAANGTYTAKNGETVRTWTPIGNATNKYTGTFDGNGKTISGLYYSGSEAYVGLFGYIEGGATIQNVGVINSCLIGSQYVGGVVGYAHRDGDATIKITNCYNTGTITVSSTSGDAYAGGIVGYVFAEGNATGTGGNRIILIDTCYNTGAITASSASDNAYAGGVAGYVIGNVPHIDGKGWDSAAIVKNFYNTGVITASSISGNAYAGGLAGAASRNNYAYVDFYYSYNIGKITATIAENLGYAGGELGARFGSEVDGVERYPSDWYFYFLEGTADKYIGNVDYLKGNITEEEFASGDIAYEFNTYGSSEVWKQTLGTDTYPSFVGGTVYKKTEIGCRYSGVVQYTNNESDTVNTPHTFTNGFCENENCDAYEEPTKDTDGAYLIKNAGQLYWFAALVNGTLDGVAKNTSANAKLTADITINSGTFTNRPGEGAPYTGRNACEWTPIAAYSGIFDGCGHTIRGLYYKNGSTVAHLGTNDRYTYKEPNSDIEYAGLFGHNEGTIKNVGVISSYFLGYQNVGGIVGHNDGTVENCYNAGYVNGFRNVGGVVGANNGTVKNCYSTGESIGFSTYYDIDCCIGGVVGANDGTVENCHNSGTVKADTSVGGIAGSNSGKITNCYNTGSVGKGYYKYDGNEWPDYEGGGIVGANQRTVENCYNTGNVNGNDYVGGIAGTNSDQIRNCYSTGTVSGNNYVGGIIGNNYYDYGTIQNCFYLSGCATGNNTTQNGIGSEDNTPVDDVEGQTTVKTETEFASGEVAYLLNGESSESEVVWKQTLKVTGKQSYPVFAGSTVYLWSDDTYHNIPEGATIDVTITWTSMEFTYTAGKWKPDKHEYTKGVWSPAEQDGGKITVTNAGTDTAKIELTFVSDEPEKYSGTFSENNFELSENESKTITFTFDGEALTTVTYRKRLGAINIKISKQTQ